MAVNKGGLAARVDGKRATTSEGARAKATGVKGISKAKYPSRGTENPVK